MAMMSLQYLIGDISRNCCNFDEPQERKISFDLKSGDDRGWRFTRAGTNLQRVYMVYKITVERKECILEFVTLSDWTSKTVNSNRSHKFPCGSDFFVLLELIHWEVLQEFC